MTFTNLPARRSSLRADERGFTLPELMVSMALTLIIGATAFQALQDANRTTEGVMAMADVNQNLRVAMNLMIRDMMGTGEGIPIGGLSFPLGGEEVPRPSPPGAAWNWEEEWSTLPAVSPGDAIGPLVNNIETDAVALLMADRRLDFTGVTLDAIAADGSTITVPVGVAIDDPAIGIRAGDLIMLTNANGSAVQEVTSVTGQTITFDSSAASNLNQPSAPDGSVMDLQNEDGTWPPTALTRINMVSYYIYVPTSGQITSPHLIRRVNYGTERVVAIGITNIQLTYDLVDGINNPTSVPDPGDGDFLDNSEMQIRKANLFLSARSLQTFGEGRDYVYSSLSTNVSFRSLAFVSRYDLQ